MSVDEYCVGEFSYYYCANYRNVSAIKKTVCKYLLLAKIGHSE